jgi:hypothetical protein
MPAEQARHRPPEALRPLVAWYSGYRETGAPPARHRGLPSPWLTLIVTLDDPLVISEHPDPRQPASPPARTRFWSAGCTPRPRWSPTTAVSPGFSSA